jgi:hypothetical protein
MLTRHGNHARSTILAVAILTVALTAAMSWLTTPLATAGDLDRLDASLKLIPEDAAFYCSALRNREQIDVFLHSNAWAKIRAMPVVQMGFAAYNAQLAVPGSGPAQCDAALKNPEVRKIVDLLAAMVSDEIFVYGDDSSLDLVELAQAVNREMRYTPLVMQMTGQMKDSNTEKLQASLLASALANHADLIDVPNIVVGFKLKSTELAKEELMKLEMFGNILLERSPKLKGRFQKTKIDQREYLTLKLDGSLVPWDKIPTDELKKQGAAEDDIQRVIDRLKKVNLVIALGVRDNYLVLSIGSSLDCLKKLGHGERLIDQPEFKPLEAFATKTLTSISYLSQETKEQINDQEQNLDDLNKLANTLLASGQLSDEQANRIRKDVTNLIADAKGMIPEVGPTVAFEFLTDHGTEDYCYAWGDYETLDDSQPLGLLQHVGGNPIFAAVLRQKPDIATYDLAVKWLKTGYGYFGDFAIPNIPENERPKVIQFINEAMPLLARFDKTNREMLFPALADGQIGLVLDGKLQSSHFIATLPATQKPMPMIEPAVVLGVSDAKLLKKAFGEYQTIANGLIDAVRHIEGINVPADLQIPEPLAEETALGTIYHFVLPQEWGVDAKIVPTVGISDHLATFSISRDHAERLLKTTPLVADGVFTKTTRPLAAAVRLDWAALVDAATPWVDFGVEHMAASKRIGESEKKAIAEQVHTGLEVFKALRTISSESYLDEDALITHTITEIRDVGK